MTDREESGLTDSITFAIEPELKARYLEALRQNERTISNGTRMLIKQYLGDIK